MTRLGRLENASGPFWTFSFTYDKVGNRRSVTQDGLDYQYNYLTGSNKLQQITGLNPMTFRQDAAGNTTVMGTRTLVYNQANRLMRVEEGSSVLGGYDYNVVPEKGSRY